MFIFHQERLKALLRLNIDMTCSCVTSTCVGSTMLRAAAGECSVEMLQMGLSVACVLGGTHGEHLCAFALWLSTEVLLQVASIAESSFLLLDSGWHCILQRTINYKASPAREGAVNILQK